MSGGHQKTVKLQKNQISQGGSSGNQAGVFGTNNMMFGNYTGGQQTGVLSSNSAGGAQQPSSQSQGYQMKKQRGQSPYDRVR